MRVILKETVENLGIVGDIVKVSDGYARNYLLPRKLVVVADETNVKSLQHYQKALEKKRLAQKEAAEELAKKLGEHSCTIKRKVGEKDQLFGSVTSMDIAAELKNAGFNIDRRGIQIADPIKTLGVHPVTVKLLPEVSASVKVWVVKEE